MRVASGSRLPVEFIGVMQLHVQGKLPGEEAQAEQLIQTTLGLTGALYVPGMPETTTLISTKKLFKQEGIKTFLNDLLYLELPNGVQVGITETETSYLIPYRIASSKQRAPPTHAWLLWLNYLSTSSTRGYVTSLLSASRPQPSAPLV